MNLAYRPVFAFLISTSALWTACSQNEPVAEARLQIDKKYTLEAWPDSVYIEHLDSVLAAEPLKHTADTAQTELTIYSGNMPTITLPGQKKSVQTPTHEKAAPSKPAPSTSGKSAERFADRFMAALGKLQSDPSNTSNFNTVEAKANEDILRLLSRAYGQDASKLPRFYTLSTLQSVNPGVRLEHLSAGDKVRIPKI